MKANNITRQNRPARLAGASLQPLIPYLTAILSAALVLGAPAKSPVPSGKTPLGILQPGDIVYADTGDGTTGNALLKVDSQTAQTTVLGQGDLLGLHGYLQGVAMDRNGRIIVATSARLLRLDPETAQLAVICDLGDGLGGYGSVAADRQGKDQIYVACEKTVLRIDPMTGEMRVVSEGGRLTCVLGIAVGKNNFLYVANVKYDATCAGWVGEVIRVNVHNGKQLVVSEGNCLTYLRGITVDGDDIYLTGMVSHDQNFDLGQVVHVNARTGVQTVVSQGENLICPVGIAMDGNGQLIVADPYTINPESPDASHGGYDGAILQINPMTGEQVVLTRGQGCFVNPFGVAVVPPSKPNDKHQ